MAMPPRVLDCAHAIEYAIVDGSVTFEQRHTLNVGGEWLGEVAQLAICRNLDETELMVFHCDRDWNVLGVAAGFDSIDEAKAKTERSYRGLRQKWVSTGYSRDDAASYLADHFKDVKCSFCGRLPMQYQSIVGTKVRICNHCVEEFHDALHREFKET
jgi:hypothetical protein